MENPAVRFACNGCGVCCKGRLIPLTLEESKQWLHRGHDVAVILEAFDDSCWPDEPQKRSHNIRRSAQVKSGNASVNVVAIFAANALTQCPNLDDQDRCGIYHDRPLVCRIYPMEISPFIALDPLNKVCPPETWSGGDIIVSDGGVAPELAAQIEQSKKADWLDAHAKVAICEAMDMTVAAWKEDALAVYLPDRNDLIEAIHRYDSGFHHQDPGSWSIRVESPTLRKSLAEAGKQFDDSESHNYIFHKL
ncbi:YkgJ family cysteine cluster protein [Pseudomonas sp. JDS28PS106]|uniref:YkgJ family cysteine cluster protein n=1 Tax=Pseudomonas sp. JDS28PS106 TaxID=2497235 RepID=UPI002FD21036